MGLTEASVGDSHARELGLLAALVLAVLAVGLGSASAAQAAPPKDGPYEFTEGGGPGYLSARVEGGAMTTVYWAEIPCTDAGSATQLALELEERGAGDIDVPLEVGQHFEFHDNLAGQMAFNANEPVENGEFVITGTVVSPWEIRGTATVSAEWPENEGFRLTCGPFGGSIVLTTPHEEPEEERKKEEEEKKKKEEKKKEEEAATKLRLEFPNGPIKTFYEIPVAKPPLVMPPEEEEVDEAGVAPCPPGTTGSVARNGRKQTKAPRALTPREKARALCKKIDPQKLKWIRELKFSPKDQKARDRIKAQLKAAIEARTLECSNSYTWRNATDFSKVIPGSPVPGIPGANKIPTAPSSFTALEFAAYANLQVCLEKLRNLEDELAVAEADPPLSSFGAVSIPRPVPSGLASPCNAQGLTAAELAECDSARTAVRAVEVEGDRLVAIGQAIAVSIDRHGGAAKAKNLAGVELQEDAYDAQVAELSQVIDRYNTANLALAHAFEGLGVDIVFSQSFAEDPAAGFRRAAKHAAGEERAALELMAHIAAAQRFSFGRSFNGDLAQAVPRGLPHVIPTPRDVNPLVQQLADAGEIPGVLASAIGGELKELTTAQGVARTALQRKLGASFRAITSGAGPMLEALTGIQSPRL